MENRRVEVRPVRPHERMRRGVYLHLIEHRQVPQRCVYRSREDWQKINYLLRRVLKSDVKRVVTNDRECLDAVNRMTHVLTTTGL